VDKEKKKTLESAGWRVGSADEFLGLTPEETAFVEVKLALSEKLKAHRTKQGLSQAQLARRLGSSQSRVAKMEAADATVSVDLLIRALIASGASRRDIARAIASAPGSRLRRDKTRGNAA
jgi:predicted XRE-type DNA-binding protein